MISTVMAGDPPDVQVLEVRLDRNTGPTTGSGGDTQGLTDKSCEDQLAELQAIINNMLDRNKLATGIATVKLKVGQDKPFLLVDGDELERLNAAFMAASQDGSMNWTLLAPDAPMERYKVTTSGLGHLTYQQPSPPWSLIYTQRDGQLHQWVRFDNFTNYEWSKATKITLSDLLPHRDNREIVFSPQTAVPRRSSAIQHLRSVKITDEKYKFKLTGGNVSATRTLKLETGGFMPVGEFRDTIQPLTNQKSATIKEGANNEVIIENDASVLAVKRKWNDEEIQEVVGLDAGTFQLRTVRTSAFVIRNTGPARFITLSKAAEAGWTKLDSDWGEEDSDYVKSLSVAEQASVTVTLTEQSNQTLSFPKDIDKLRAVAKSFASSADGFPVVLKQNVAWYNELQNNIQAIKELTSQIGELTEKYDKQPVGQDLRNDASIRRYLRGLWEKRQPLVIEKDKLELRNLELESLINKSLYPATL